MPRGPEGEKRPADAIGNAVMIARIATGEIEDHHRGRQECRRSTNLMCNSDASSGLRSYA